MEGRSKHLICANSWLFRFFFFLKDFKKCVKILINDDSIAKLIDTSGFAIKKIVVLPAEQEFEPPSRM